MHRTGGVERRPKLVSFPSEDRAFAREVQASLAGERSGSPEELEQFLRSRFPRTVVRRSVLSDEPSATWYVFRDGRVRPA